MRFACSRVWPVADASCCPDAKVAIASASAAAFASTMRRAAARVCCDVRCVLFMLVMPDLNCRPLVLGNRRFAPAVVVTAKSAVPRQCAADYTVGDFTRVTVSIARRRVPETVPSASRARVVSPPRCGPCCIQRARDGACECEQRHAMQACTTSATERIQGSSHAHL